MDPLSRAREFFGCEVQSGAIVHTEFCNACPRGQGCVELAALAQDAEERARQSMKERP